MKYIIKHDIQNRIRVHILNQKINPMQADAIVYHLKQNRIVVDAKAYEETSDVVVKYNAPRKVILETLAKIDINNIEVPKQVVETSSRKMNTYYKEKLVGSIVQRYAIKFFVPPLICTTLTILSSFKFIKEGLKSLYNRKFEVPVLDGTAIFMAIMTRDYNTASSIMFMLNVGELLEEWTHKKSVGDLARSLSLNIEKAWLETPEGLVLVDVDEIKEGDIVHAEAGNAIPFDGVVKSGEATVNQTTLTGESEPVFKKESSTVFASTVIEEGSLKIIVNKTTGMSRYEMIQKTIEENEKMKSQQESKAEHLADKLVPFTFIGTGLVYAITKNLTKAMAVLMVDYSCALKLAMPVTILASMSEANRHGITVKGGIYLEKMAQADTIVFDKTGTITKATPAVVDVVSFTEKSSDEMLRKAACLEEHFPHSMAKAVVKAAADKGLEHKEMHTKVHYIVAHGIRSTIDEREVIIGSRHFIFDDEKTKIPEDQQAKFDNLPNVYSHLYMAIDGVLAAVICIEDPIRREAKETITKLKKEGFKRIVMMTGDSKHIASSVAHEVGIDEYYAEVLPDDKAKFVTKLVEEGNTVVMIGDGINDSPALSASDVGIAISDGAEIAREVSDVTIAADNLNELVTLRELSVKVMERVNNNYKAIIGINSTLIGLGVLGLIKPTTSALLHNTSTIAITLESMKDELPEKAPEDKCWLN